MSGKKIALTGGTGFVGKELLSALINAGYTVVALNRRYRLDFLPRHECLTWASLEDLKNDLRTRRFDAVVHLATAYGRGQMNSEVVSANIELPLSLLECAVLGGCVLFINTDTFFAKPRFNYPYMQSYVLSKVNLLGWLRLAVNMTPKLKIVNVRLEHVYGPNDGAQKFVPFVLQKLLNHDQLDLTPGDQMRDFIYSQDVAEAYLTLIKSSDSLPAGLTEVELGTGIAISVKAFVRAAKEISGSLSVLNFGAQTYRDREIMHSVADARVLKDIGWRPRYSLHQGIQATLASIIESR